MPIPNSRTHSAITAAVFGKWQNWFLDLRSLPPGVFAFPLLPESLEDAVVASLVDGLTMRTIDGSGCNSPPLRQIEICESEETSLG